MDVTILDNISVGVLAQVLPIVGIFGQDLTNSFLRESVQFSDFITFAVGPLGIIWILTVILKTVGPECLKKHIQNREENVVIEKNLLSSTSSQVCELWNGRGVERLIGHARIREFFLFGQALYLPEDVKYGQIQPNDIAHGHIANGDLKKPKTLERYLVPKGMLLQKPTYEQGRYDSQPLSKPPNLSLNMGQFRRKFTSRVIGLAALLFEIGLIALLAAMKYDKFLQSQFKIFTYSFICAMAGTVVLFIGLILAAYQICNLPRQIIWELTDRCPRKAYILWLQRGLDELDELDEKDDMFTSYVLVQEVRNEIRECHKDTGNDEDAAIIDIEDGRANLPSTSLLTQLVGTVIGTVTFVCVGGGYASQVLGVAGMHYPTQISIFGLTLLMLLLRVLSRKVPEPTSYKEIKSGHEMDWLALMRALDPEGLYRTPKCPPPWTIRAGETWQVTPGKSTYTEDLLKQRQGIDKICGWPCPATAMARSLCNSIIHVITQGWQIQSGKIEWSLPIDLRRKRKDGQGWEDETETLTFSVSKNVSQADKKRMFKQFERVLSLWLFYLKQSDTPMSGWTVLFLGPRSIGRELENFWLSSGRYFRRLRYLRKAEPEDETYAVKRTLTVLRNHLFGFQEGLSLQSQFDVNDNINFVVPAHWIGSHSLQECHPAVYMSSDNITSLLAQHIFSGFMWAYSKNVKDKIIDLTSTNTASYTQGKYRQKYFNLADYIESTGLCDSQVALLMMLSPLTAKRKSMGHEHQISC